MRCNYNTSHQFNWHLDVKLEIYNINLKVWLEMIICENKNRISPLLPLLNYWRWSRITGWDGCHQTNIRDDKAMGDKKKSILICGFPQLQCVLLIFQSLLQVDRFLFRKWTIMFEVILDCYYISWGNTFDWEDIVSNRASYKNIVF